MHWFVQGLLQWVHTRKYSGKCGGRKRKETKRKKKKEREMKKERKKEKRKEREKERLKDFYRLLNPGKQFCSS